MSERGMNYTAHDLEVFP